MKCHYIYDKKVGKVLIPGCWGTVIHGIENCTCRPKKQPKEKDPKDLLISELEKENARLNRIIKTLISK